MHHYSGPVREIVVMRWLKDRLAERLEYITDPLSLDARLKSLRKDDLNPEIHAILFSQTSQPPVFYSALSVKFPGRVKFSIVNVNAQNDELEIWKQILQTEKIYNFPSYIIYSTERNYTYGLKNGEFFSFSSMEKFLRFLYPCLNDIFIISFFLANTMSLFEPFISNCGILKRIGKYIWCTLKYNAMVIMLWLPIIALFQMPYFDSIPLLILKIERIFATSYLGSILRSDYAFYIDRPIFVYISFLFYLIVVTILCKKYRDEETGAEDWFNYRNMNSLSQMRPNNFIGPVGSGGYDLLRGLEIFGSRITQPQTWLNPVISSDYIQYLPTFRFTPVPIAELAAKNAVQVCATMTKSQSDKLDTAAEDNCNNASENQIENEEIAYQDNLGFGENSDNLDNLDSATSDVPSLAHNGIPAGYVYSHQCVICLDDYVPNAPLCGLPCGHVFHETCIFSWLNTEKHFCPMCRWPSYKIPEPVSNRL